MSRVDIYHSELQHFLMMNAWEFRQRVEQKSKKETETKGESIVRPLEIQWDRPSKTKDLIEIDWVSIQLTRTL